MNEKRIAIALVAVAWACSSSTNTTGGATSGSTGAEGGCMPALGASPSGCPDTTAAEAAFGKVEGACGTSQGDYDFSDAMNPKPKTSARPKICGSCACRQAVFDYFTLYKNCTGSDKANAAFAANLYGVAKSC